MNVDLNAILQAITTVGFPVVCCGGLFYYIMFKDRTHKEETKALSETLKSCTETMTEAINNNTVVMAEICGKIGVDFKIDEL